MCDTKCETYQTSICGDLNLCVSLSQNHYKKSGQPSATYFAMKQNYHASHLIDPFTKFWSAQ
jgi:hypothetical protein